ncbi:site-specific integrase [Polaromonas sp. JS666]|uniref:site-specific integrase n=1 Tax=Polaromonas sp. (strain JS666 / ATCC BAA-500) TaxID=296591 RepID=UPI0000535668|nr:site-specific integrase [Polaromonas sp. JS666]ABE42335.1 phage integrase [Polaromonas sp. JS666]
MGSIRRLESQGTLFMDFRYAGQRLREYTMLPDMPANRKRLQKALDRIETDIALGTFDYEKTFGKPLPQPEPKTKDGSVDRTARSDGLPVLSRNGTPLFGEFAQQWFTEVEVSWRRSYRITQKGALDKYLLPFFGDKEVGHITKADVLAFRASLAKVTTRKSQGTLSNRRVNAVMKPLRQILNEAADRFEFNSAFRNIKPLKMKRSDVQPFTLDEVELILNTVRVDYRNYFNVRFFTGMRTGEAHGLKWKYVDFERRLILVRESIVLNEEDELKTDGSVRDIHMSQVVYDALKAQYQAAGEFSEYVFCSRSGQPINNQNFLNRVWNPLLRHLGLEHRRAYQMRHTAATLWLASGEAPEWIARQLGHTSTEMLFRVYSRYVPNLTRQDGSAMERLLASRMSTGANVRADNPPAPVNKVVPQPLPKLRGITGGRATRPKSGRTNVLPDYFGDAEPQPPPAWHRAPVNGTGPRHA